ncbi:MAG: FAD-binding protein [Chloroflexi bacterium]|nr:FAD-binding protein [Chloroflexota bacterium]
MMKHQVIVVGGGLAGLRAAVETAMLGVDTAVLSLLYPVRSHSGAAQGGINGALANMEECKDDSPAKHAYDTIKGSDFMADQDCAEIMTTDAPARIYELEHWGVPFSRTADGRIAQRPFGGAGYPRTCYAADKTGLYILHTLNEQAVKHGIKVYNEWAAIAVASDGTASHGLVALNLQTGEIESFAADAIIFATGGAGRIFRRTSNAMQSTGYCLGVAYKAGVPLKDMEFVQFHPTTIVGTNILMSEAARGEGGYLVNNQGERFMARYAAKAMELAPRDIVSRSIQTEINEGRGFPEGGGCVHLDLRHLGREKILERLPGIRDLAISFLGIDCIEKPIWVQPGQHFIMGGIDTDKDGATILPGLYAAGECAAVSVHGANRLGGNSLLECVVMGQRSGAAAAQYVKGKASAVKEAVLADAAKKATAEVEALLNSEGKERLVNLRDRMADTMTNHIGIYREEKAMKEALATLQELRVCYRQIGVDAKTRKFNLDLLRTIELGGMLDAAEAMAAGALARQESRGAHSRLDFKTRDDANWLKHTLAHHTPDGARLEYEPVTITKWQPEERKY